MHMTMSDMLFLHLLMVAVAGSVGASIARPPPPKNIVERHPVGCNTPEVCIELFSSSYIYVNIVRYNAYLEFTMFISIEIH